MIEFSHHTSYEKSESEVLSRNLNNLRTKIYNILLCLKTFKVVKDMRVLIISKLLE